jgi:hypothetical protein
MKQIFPLAAAPASLGSWLLIALLMAVPLVLAFYFFYAPRAVRFETSTEGLRIRGDLFYSRMIPAGEILASQARALDLHSDHDHQLKWRRNGTALPNYKGGWFTLRNGEKALVFLGDSARIAYIPIRSGYSVMLGVDDPERLLATLPGRRD